MEYERLREEATREYNRPGGIRNLQAYAESLSGTLREYADRLLAALDKRNRKPDTRIWKLSPSLIEQLTA